MLVIRCFDEIRRGMFKKRTELIENRAEKLIIFIYYIDLQKGIDFYEKFLGFPIEIDQGFCKIYRISDAEYVSIVDEKEGMHKWNEIKPVQIYLRVHNIQAFYKYCKEAEVDALSEMF